jgi:hypothetical protein
VKVRGRNVYSLPLLLGDLQAVFEVVEGRDSECEYGVDGEGTLGVSVKAR